MTMTENTYSQTQAAKVIGVSRWTLNAWANNRNADIALADDGVSLDSSVVNILAERQRLWDQSLSITDFAEEVGVSRETLYKYIKAGKYDGFIVLSPTGKKRIHPSALEGDKSKRPEEMRRVENINPYFA